MTTTTDRPSVTVTLEEPIIRGEQRIEQLQLLRPRTGDLRGMLLADVAQMKADAVAQLLPRITVPTILKHEVDAMAPADLVVCAGEVAGFLLPKAVLASLNA